MPKAAATPIRVLPTARGRTAGALLAFLLAARVLFSLPAPAAELQKFSFEKAEMGVPFRVTLYAENAAEAETAADAAFARVAELNATFSDYEADTELVRLSKSAGKGEKVKLSAPLWTVLERSQHLAERTEGAFDVTCGPLTALWRLARRRTELPAPELVAEARAHSGWKKMRLDPAARTAELLAPDMRLDLGSLAKGYAVDAALRVLREGGHPQSMVAGGGDMAIGDAPPGRKGWRIEIAPLDTQDGVPKPPVAFVELAKAGVATSGDRYQRLEMNGQRYSHILDMRTGQPLTDHALVTVLGPDCFTASLSTALCILGPTAGLPLAAEEKVAARWQRQPADKVEITETPDWKKWSVE